MVTVFKTPAETVGSSSTISYVNAVHQPIEFIFKREDFQIDSLTDSGGNVKIVTGDDFSSEDMEVGKLLKVVSSVPEYNGSWTILSSTPPLDVVIDLPYISSATGYVICLNRKNWRVESYIEVRNIDGTLTRIGDDSRRSDLQDKISYNVAPYLKSHVLMDDTFNFDVQNKADKFESGSYLVSYKEVYDGYNTSFVNIADEFSYVNAIMQPRYKYGSNMAGYIFGNEFNLIKWLTMFEIPTQFIGFPFCLNFLYYLAYKGTIIQNQTSTNVNGDFLSGDTYSLDQSQNGYLNRTLSPDIYDGCGTTVKRKKISLTAAGSIISEIIFVDLNSDCCHQNPVYLNWLGTDGSRNFWLFEKGQTVNLDTENVSNFEPYVTELATQRGDVFELENTAGNSLTISAINVPIDKVKGIKTMLYSLNVLMLVNPNTWEDEGVIWEQVRPVKGSFAIYNTNESRTDLTCTIQLMATNIQSR